MKKIMLSVLCLTLLVSATFFASGCKKKHTHSFTEQTVKDEYLSIAADCTNKAKYFYSCSCGEKGSATFEYGEALNHSFTNYVSDSNATCTEDGTKTAKCDRCNQTDTITDIDSTLPFIGASKMANNGCNQVFGYIFGYKRTTSNSSSIDGATYQYTYSRGYYYCYIPTSLKTVILSGSVTTISNYAFV